MSGSASVQDTELTFSPKGGASPEDDNRKRSETLMSLLSRGETLIKFIDESKKSSTTNKVSTAPAFAEDGNFASRNDEQRASKHNFVAKSFP